MKCAVFVIMLSVLTCTFAEYVVQMENGLPLRKNFIDAHVECVKKGLLVATPDTNEDNDLFKEFLNNHGNTIVWISANDMIKESEYQWMTTGKPIINTNMWHSGQPTKGTDERCVILDHVHRNLLWNNVACSSLALVVCQRATEADVALAKSRIPILQQALEQKY